MGDLGLPGEKDFATLHHVLVATDPVRLASSGLTFIIPAGLLSGTKGIILCPGALVS